MLLASLAHYLRLSFIFDPFISRVPALDSVRGARSLFSEPSFVPSISSLYILVIYLFRSYTSTFRFYTSISALAISSLLSLSGQLLVVSSLSFLSLSISISISVIGALLRFSFTKSFLRYLLLALGLISSLIFSVLLFLRFIIWSIRTLSKWGGRWGWTSTLGKYYPLNRPKWIEPSFKWCFRCRFFVKWGRFSHCRISGHSWTYAVCFIGKRN